MANVIGGLRSLQFESFLTDGQLKLSHLRTLSHALTFTACAQATFLVSVLRDARLIDIKHMCQSGDREIHDASLCVGIIGCGRFGRQLATSLLTFGEITPSNLKISTRRPELLNDLASQGVLCTSNNAIVAGSVSILFICCLPAHLPSVAADIRGNLTDRTIVFSVVTAVPVSRLKLLLDGNPNILRPEMVIPEPSKIQGRMCCWDVSKGIESALGEAEAVKLTCPLSDGVSESIVKTRERFAEILVYAVAYFLVGTQLSSRQKLTVLNALILGQTKQTRVERVFTTNDFDDLLENNGGIDLVHIAVADESTPVGRKLITDPAIRRAFIDRYCDVFEQHLRWAAKTAAGADCVTGAAARKKRIDNLLYSE